MAEDPETVKKFKRDDNSIKDYYEAWSKIDVVRLV